MFANLAETISLHVVDEKRLSQFFNAFAGGRLLQKRGRFYFMTLQQLIKESGLKLTAGQRCRIGIRIKQKAYEKKVKFKKVEEVIMASDYPDEFIPEMQDTILEFISKQSKK